mmetsp:Transcript_167537/g.537994  ORF Transcript_167537/g.537994 Transcript_167537/m.537994 type:complete len:424 (+) Transcript_167537:109-1380(+)
MQAQVKNTFISVEGHEEDDQKDPFRRRQVSEPSSSMSHGAGLGRYMPEMGGYETWAQEVGDDDEDPTMAAQRMVQHLAGEDVVAEPMRVQTGAPSLATAMASLARSVGGEMPNMGGGPVPNVSALGGAPVPPAEWANTTTVMMRNLPNKYTQRMLLTEINHTGFLGTFDFLYLPIDPETNANRGYSFLNFIDPGFAWMFKMSYEGRKMNRFNSNKVVSIVPATLQGFEANYAHYASSRVNRGDPSARPLFLREPKQPLAPSGKGGGDGGDDWAAASGAGRGGGGKGGRRRAGANGCGGGYDMGLAAGNWAGACGGMGDMGSYLGFDGGACSGPYPVVGGSVGGISRPCAGGGSSEAAPAAPSGAGASGSGRVPSFCPSCGGKIQPQFQFCPHCGGGLDFVGGAGAPAPDVGGGSMGGGGEEAW